VVGARQEQLVEELLGAAEHGGGRLGLGAWRFEAVVDEHVIGEVVLCRKADVSGVSGNGVMGGALSSSCTIH